jgi:hypothetical protein
MQWSWGRRWGVGYNKNRQNGKTRLSSGIQKEGEKEGLLSKLSRWISLQIIKRWCWFQGEKKVGGKGGGIGADEGLGGWRGRPYFTKARRPALDIGKLAESQWGEEGWHVRKGERMSASLGLSFSERGKQRGVEEFLPDRKNPKKRIVLGSEERPSGQNGTKDPYSRRNQIRGETPPSFQRPSQEGV